MTDRPHPPDAPRRRCVFAAPGLLGLAALAGLTGCVSIGGGDTPAHTYLRLHDGGAAPVRLAQPLLPSLLVQPVPGDAMADTQSMVYARQPGEYHFYQYASWTERPDRQVPQLLRERLERRGVARAVGLLGDPQQADWLLSVSVDRLYHDVRSEPGEGQVAITVTLFDRRQRARVAWRRFEAQAPCARADSAAAAEALSQALGQAFDALVPWLEAALAAPAGGR